MQESRFIAGLFFAAVVALGVGNVSGQEFPNKPVRILTGPAGGSPDLALRQIGPEISGALGQPMIVDNRPGSIPSEVVSKAPPDGYTLLLDGGSFWIAPLLQPTPYDVVKDFSPVVATFSAPNVLVVHVTVPANSVKELIALAKSKPGVLNYASSTTGSSSHLAGELFKAMAGVNIVRIVYKGPVLATAAVLAGEEVQMQFAPPSSAMQSVKAGKLRALGVTSAQPSALAPGVPTMAASGLPGYESGTAYGVFSPAKTPVAIINRLNQEFVRVLAKPEAKDRLLAIGLDVTPGGSSEAFGAMVRSEMAKWGKLIKEANIKVE